MKSALIRNAMMFVVAMYGVSQLAACNTVEGAGKDTQRVGEKVEDMADDAKN
jgi:predicted small secreted protein